MGVPLTAVELAAALDLTGPKAAEDGVRLLALAVELVNIEGAGSAPVAVANEALIRTAPHLADRAAVTSKLSRLKVNDYELQFRQSAASAVRLSGARALLAPWKRRGL